MRRNKMTTQGPKNSQKLLEAIQNETEKFKECYLWMESSFPPMLFEELGPENVILIAHNFMAFHLQEYFSTIQLKSAAIAMCLETPDADIKILKHYDAYGIKNYQVYVSRTPPPFLDVNSNVRVVAIHFTGVEELDEEEAPYKIENKEELKQILKQNNPEVTDDKFESLVSSMSSRFLRSLPPNRLILALEMFFRAQSSDSCQYEVRYNEDWEKSNSISMQIVLAWKNTPKHGFLYRLARTIFRHKITLKRVSACYINPFHKGSTIVMTLGLHGSNGQPVWDVANIPDFLKELVTLKYFPSFEVIDYKLVNTGIISGNMGNLLRAMVSFIHQCLVNVDVNLYTVDNIVEGLCRHPELTATLCEVFRLKFDPQHHDEYQYLKVSERLYYDIDKLDTGHEENDIRRKDILKQGLNFVQYTLKTNFYNKNLTAFSFRLDPKYLDNIPFNREERFPELPYAIMFIKGMHYFGFHIRFKDLSRGGLRTVFPLQFERMRIERNYVFAECYNLAYTQHKKNKDIPEGGAKGVIFLKPFDRLELETLILRREFDESNLSPEEIEKRIDTFQEHQKLEYLYHSQRTFVEALISIVNQDQYGRMKPDPIVDYLNRPEYIYLGPDENMHDNMIVWIADYAKKVGYIPPGSAFISSKPGSGINHKEYGVTSLGVNVYMEKVLKYLGIDPYQQEFTIKMSGGPDGDVAGNQICNLWKYYAKTAKLVALTDGTGTIYDPKGLDLEQLTEQFKRVQGISYYPPQKLNEGGFLVDKETKRIQTALVQQTLCWRMKEGRLVEDWISGSEMNHLLRNNVHGTKVDVFIPAGGRPRTLNESNYQEFLDEAGKPTAKAIIEGANLYLTPGARKSLEERGALIIKDSSANKTGVICSSFEVLCGLALGDILFIENKEALVSELLERIKVCAANEANLLLNRHTETKQFLTDISDQISKRINQFTDQLLAFLENVELSKDPEDPLIKSYLNYCLPTLKNKFTEQLLNEIPDSHKKAVIACHLASQVVYKNGLNWFPSIVDVLPVLLKY